MNRFSDMCMCSSIAVKWTNESLFCAGHLHSDGCGRPTGVNGSDQGTAASCCAWTSDAR